MILAAILGLLVLLGPRIARETYYALKPSPGWAPRNCAEARALGIAPIYRGQRGYAPHLDWDNDGIACEPWPRWRR